MIVEKVPKARRSMIELPKLDKMEVIEHVEGREDVSGVGGVGGVDVVVLQSGIYCCTRPSEDVVGAGKGARVDVGGEGGGGVEEVHVDEDGRRYSWNPTLETSEWLDEVKEEVVVEEVVVDEVEEEDEYNYLYTQGDADEDADGVS